MITQTKLKELRLELPEEIHVYLEKTLNPLAPVREVEDKNVSRKINIHLDYRTNEQIKQAARENNTNKNEIIKALFYCYLDRIKQNIDSKHLLELRDVANQYITAINLSGEFTHRISLTKSTLISAIVTVLLVNTDIKVFLTYLK